MSSSKRRVLTNAEGLVRAVVSCDFKQQVDDATVHAIARKVSRAMPARTYRDKAAHKAGRQMPVHEGAD